MSFSEDLFDGLDLLELLLERIAPLLVTDQTLPPKLLLLALGHPHEIILLNTDLLPELPFYLLSHLAAHSYFPRFFVILEVSSEFADQKRLFSLLLDFQPSCLLVFLGEDC